MFLIAFVLYILAIWYGIGLLFTIIGGIVYDINMDIEHLALGAIFGPIMFVMILAALLIDLFHYIGWE